MAAIKQRYVSSRADEKHLLARLKLGPWLRLSNWVQEIFVVGFVERTNTDASTFLALRCDRVRVSMCDSGRSADANALADLYANAYAGLVADHDWRGHISREHARKHRFAHRQSLRRLL